MAGRNRELLAPTGKSAYQQWGLSESAAMSEEFASGEAVTEAVQGAREFAAGRGRHRQL